MICNFISFRQVVKCTAVYLVTVWALAAVFVIMTQFTVGLNFRSVWKKCFKIQMAKLFFPVVSVTFLVLFMISIIIFNFWFKVSKRHHYRKLLIFNGLSCSCLFESVNWMWFLRYKTPYRVVRCSNTGILFLFLCILTLSSIWYGLVLTSWPFPPFSMA